MDPIFDHRAAAAHRHRALAPADAGADFLMVRAAEDLADRLATVERRFGRAATIFCGTGHAQTALSASGKVIDSLRVEVAGIAPPQAVVAHDPETLPLEPGTVDLAVSLYALHALNDVPGMLIQIRRALRPDGLFLGCMAGAGTLAELREALLVAETELAGGASPRVSPLADVRDVGGLLQRAGFALPVADLETATARYDSMFALIRDLRAMGATNALVARSRRPGSRALFARAAEVYAERFSDPDGRVRATFATIWMSGWAPHTSQQKPLKPGSATMPLARVLGGDPKV